MLKQATAVRQQHNLIQGTPEWLEFRATHDGASEASAMLGLSKKTKRNELLRLKHLGIGKEFSDYVQKYIIDPGHEIEDLARPIVEEMIGTELYPTTWSYGCMSASCDGLTADDEEGWENKRYNAEYYEMVLRGEVPEEHMPQVQQCLYVTGAKRWFFTISDGTKERTAGVWVYPDEAWFERIESGWDRFNKDRENFVLTEVKEPVKAEPVKELPMVNVQVKGELTSSNLQNIAPLFDRFLAEAKVNLVTDEDFAQAEAEAKVGRDTAKKCKLAAKSVVDQMLSISEVTRTLEDYAAKFDALALRQEKLVKSEKENRKAHIIAIEQNAFNDHVRTLQAEISQVTLVTVMPAFGEAVKGKKTLSSMQDAVDTMLANAKIDADKTAMETREKLAWLNENHKAYAFLYHDLQQLISKPVDDFKLVISTRVNDHIRDEEIRKEEDTKEQAEREKQAEERGRLQAGAELKRKAAIEEVKTEPVKHTEPVCETINTSYVDTSPLPSRQRIIDCVARTFFITKEVAEQHLIKLFGAI